MDLFESALGESAIPDQPLAERLRPRTFDDFVGQHKIVGAGSALMKNFIEKGQLPNLILWGPPGTGKTTFAHLLATKIDAEFIVVNAVDTGAKSLKEIGQAARDRKLHFQKKTILFVDEIHRFNKAQQDVLLPFSERGDFILVGATTENPSYELNSALLSRSRVLVFELLEPQDLQKILERAANFLKVNLNEVVSSEAQSELAQMVRGDARQLLNFFDQIYHAFINRDETSIWPLPASDIEKIVQGTPVYYDKTGDEHYNSISAFIKSIRGSDPDAGLYYLARMLDGGEDPVFIARRLVILASEDVGNADPRGLSVAVAGLQAVEAIGLPEAAINLAQVVTYLACAPKSNRSYEGLIKAREFLQKTGRPPVPKALRSAQTRLAEQLGFGRDYKYSHAGSRGFVEQNFFPEGLTPPKFYEPTDRGFEKNITQYQQWVRKRTPFDSAP